MNGVRPIEQARSRKSDVICVQANKSSPHEAALPWNMRESIIASRSDVYIPLKPDLDSSQIDLDYSSGQIRHWQTSDLCASIPPPVDARPFGLIYERRMARAAGRLTQPTRPGRAAHRTPRSPTC